MRAGVKAGAAYFAIMFGIGFALGTFRVLVVLARLGESGAVLLELPVMLSLSWVVCARLVRRFAVLPASIDRIMMGLVAFALLMLGEIGVSVLAFGRTLAEHFGNYREFAQQVGLAAQIVFALFPLVQALKEQPNGGPRLRA